MTRPFLFRFSISLSYLSLYSTRGFHHIMLDIHFVGSVSIRQLKNMEITFAQSAKKKSTKKILSYPTIQLKVMVS